ncbi:hypothetical protein [Lutibaculum baratangense]|uniref:Uncharacterized protein n=1 Tax=Lutibaculum baratangense AMV1 TaxID=631454 RepID=V4QZ90_9HYPH|nr:hypothetical protein [Lutibaculum baratangense]ESR25067.1 hypothetical protein N177_1941 [Lutibaculum baratangense AMV1]
MQPWAKIALSALLTGTVASLVTTAALAGLARREGRSAVQPTHATSHWLHGEGAGHVEEIDLAHTGLGFATHHASAGFWALPFEAWLATRPPRSTAELLRDATVMAGIAAVVDYRLVPKRLTPGWEEVLSPRSIAAVYGTLALALAAGATINQRLAEDRPPGTRR